MLLCRASQKAESVLTEVTEKASQAEVVKNQVQIVKEKAEALVAKIAEEKAYAEEKLEAAKPALVIQIGSNYNKKTIHLMYEF